MNFECIYFLNYSNVSFLLKLISVGHGLCAVDCPRLPIVNLFLPSYTISNVSDHDEFFWSESSFQFYSKTSFYFYFHYFQAILCYWLTTNIISLIQVGFLRIPKVRSYFQIEQLLTITPVKGAGQKKGFRESLREGAYFIVYIS